MQFLKTKTFPIAAIIIALAIAYAIWNATGNGWWTAGVAIVGGIVAGGFVAFIVAKIGEARRHPWG